MQKIQRPRELKTEKSVIKCEKTSDFLLENPEKSTEGQKEKIYIPEFRLLKSNELTVQPKTAKFKDEYIRLMYNFILPNDDEYILDEEDLSFIQKNTTINEDIFEKICQESELQSDKQNFVQKEQFVQLALNLSIQETEIMKIYEYIVKKRENVKKPLLRCINKPAIDDPSHQVAFRPRTEKKMALRASYRQNNHDTLEKMKMLKTEMKVAQHIIDLIGQRENFKSLLDDFDFTSQFYKKNQKKNIKVCLKIQGKIFKNRKNYCKNLKNYCLYIKRNIYNNNLSLYKKNILLQQKEFKQKTEIQKKTNPRLLIVLRIFKNLMHLYSVPLYIQKH